MHKQGRSLWRRSILLLWILATLGLSSYVRAESSQELSIARGDSLNTLSLSDIEALGLHEITMHHPEGPEGTFSGVWLDALLKNQGLNEASRVRFIAEDGYTTFLTPKERSEKRYLLVTRLDGKPVTQKDLGPYMLIVPDDAEAALEGSVSITRWIWAIRKIQAR